MGVQLQLLGVPRVECDDRILAISWQRKSLSLLTYLFTARGLVAREAVASALWPDDDEEDARANLRRNLTLLRGALPPAAAEWISIDPGSLAFDRRVANTDVAEFELLASDASRYAEAVGRYGGDFAEPLADPWVLAERERLRIRFHTILAELSVRSFSARRFDEALDYARRILADEPFREDVLRRVIAIRYAMGDRPGALVEFERFQRALEREMDVVPMPETCALRDLVLRGDPLPAAPDAAARQHAAGSASNIALLPFGGRGAAFDELRAAWEAAASGAGGAVFVSGEAGIGKTRLIAEISEREIGAGARFVRGTTASPEARPFEPILGALAGAAPFLASIDLEAVWLDVLAPLVPDWPPRANQQPLAPLPPERETLRIFEAVSRLLVAMARARPLVVVFEDLHWAGHGTLAAIRHVVARVRGHRVLVLATYRDGEGREAERLRRELCAAGQARAVALVRLSEEETSAILAQLDEQPSPDDVRTLAARSEGNPLFLTELLRESPGAPRAVSSGIAELVRTRLMRASPDVVVLARVAALSGSSFDVDLLRAVMGWSDGPLIDGLAELLERQFIRATATYEGGSYAFTHALVREAIAEATPDGERRHVHHIVARALEARASDDRHAVEIAAHWAAADEPERAARAYAKAARASLAVHARDEAALLASAGAALTRDSRLRFELVQLRIEANLQRVQTQILDDDVALATALAAELDENDRYMAALLAHRVAEIEADVATRRDRVRALRQFRDDAVAPLRAAQIADAEAKTALVAADFPGALEAAGRAAGRYREVGASDDELRALLFAARVHGRVGEPSTAEALLASLEARVVASADLGITMDYWFARTQVGLARYDAPAMLYATDHWHSAALKAGDRIMEAKAIKMASSAHGIAGRLTHALREGERASAIYAALGVDKDLWLIRNTTGWLLLQLGRIAEATAILRDNLQYFQAERLLESEYCAVNNLGLALLAGGAVAEACALQRRALAQADELESDFFMANALGDLGHALAAGGELTEGLAKLREAAAISERLRLPPRRAYDLARAAYWDESPRSAAADAHAALAIVEAHSEQIWNGPEILWYCAAAFERAADSGAQAYALRRGRELLDRCIAAIEDPDDRRVFCALPYHAALLEEGAQSRSRGRVKASTKAKASSNAAK
jgi:DNA-binding SARP family transcriptional activator